MRTLPGPCRIATAMAILAVAMLVPSVSAATSVHIAGHFTQWFGGRNGDGVTCSGEAYECGTGRVDGYGRGTDAFYFTEQDGDSYAITLADGSSVTVHLDFADAATPGRSGDAVGRFHAFGNPVTVTFAATVTDASGRWAGATGGGTVTLGIAGNVDQITSSLDLVLP